MLASTGCSDSPKRTQTDERATDRTTKRTSEIPEDDRRVIIERPSNKRTYRLSSRDEPAAATGERTTPPPVAEPPPPREEGIRIYEVQPKDTLWSLSNRFYGHSRHWRRIYAANRNRVGDPRELPVGIKLIIP